MSPTRTIAENVEAQLPRYLVELEQLVNIDCGSYTPEGVNRVADFCADAFGALGASVERLPAERLGDLVIGRLAGEGPRLLLIGHMDTVFDPGTAAERPFRHRARPWGRSGRIRHRPNGPRIGRISTARLAASEG